MRLFYVGGNLSTKILDAVSLGIERLFGNGCETATPEFRLCPRNSKFRYESVPKIQFCLGIEIGCHIRRADHIPFLEIRSKCSRWANTEKPHVDDVFL